jgi:hypothetical protein
MKVVLSLVIQSLIDSRHILREWFELIKDWLHELMVFISTYYLQLFTIVISLITIYIYIQ